MSSLPGAEASHGDRTHFSTGIVKIWTRVQEILTGAPSISHLPSIVLLQRCIHDVVTLTSCTRMIKSMILMLIMYGDLNIGNVAIAAKYQRIQAPPRSYKKITREAARPFNIFLNHTIDNIHSNAYGCIFKNIFGSIRCSKH